MADGESKIVSPRGAFFVGLSLGLGVAIVLYVFQTERLKNEVNHLREDVLLEHKKWANEHEAYCIDKYGPSATPATATPSTENK
jgi:hypothetical protein